MAPVNEPSLFQRSVNVGLVVINLILLGYAVRDYTSSEGSVRALLLPIGGLTLASALLLSPRRPRLSWALLVVTFVVNAVWFVRTAT
jgi:hypothetical protein